jgi:rare lipoprotein A
MHLRPTGICFLVVLLGTIVASAADHPARAFDFLDEANPEMLAMLPPIVPPPVIEIDHSGRRQTGEASYYARKFQNRKMANGKPFKMNSNVAASKSLPLGTVARVTNLKNGKSAVVKIQDRGPFRKGTVVDLTPRTAAKLDLKHDGVAPVIVSPISVPQRDGSIRLGAGAAPRSRILDRAEAQAIKPGPRRTAAPPVS